jgi:hypothetical protein
MLHVHVSTFLEFHKQKTELAGNSNFRLFPENGKWKLQTSICLLQTETQTDICFPRSANEKGIQRLLSQQICPSMLFPFLVLFNCLSILLFFLLSFSHQLIFVNFPSE